MTTRYITIEVRTDDDQAQGDEFEMTFDIVQEALDTIHLDGVRLEAGEFNVNTLAGLVRIR